MMRKLVEDYLTDVAKLKEDGYLKISVANLLLLVLATYSKRIAVLYTNKDDQCIIIITPTVNTETSSTIDNSSSQYQTCLYFYNKRI